MLGPSNPPNPDIPRPDEPTPPPAEEPEDEFGEGDTPEAVPREPADEPEKSGE